MQSHAAKIGEFERGWNMFRVLDYNVVLARREEPVIVSGRRGSWLALLGGNKKERLFR